MFTKEICNKIYDKILQLPNMRYEDISIDFTTIAAVTISSHTGDAPYGALIAFSMAAEEFCKSQDFAIGISMNIVINSFDNQVGNFIDDYKYNTEDLLCDFIKNIALGKNKDSMVIPLTMNTAAHNCIAFSNKYGKRYFEEMYSRGYIKRN